MKSRKHSKYNNRLAQVTIEWKSTISNQLQSKIMNLEAVNLKKQTIET